MTQMNTYQIGDTFAISALFYNTANVLTDPSGVVIKLMNPASGITTWTYGTDATVIRSAQGVYYATGWIPTGSSSAAGLWRFWAYGTGVIKAAQQGAFQVERSPFFTG